MSIYIEDKNGKRRKFAGVGSEKDYIDDGIASEKMTWSSEKILDTLCPPFSVSGNPVICHPVEDYPLSAVVTLEPKQAGSGDPSPDNVRPITGRDEVTVNLRGNNLLDPASFTEGVLNSNGEINVSPGHKTTGFISVIAGARISHTRTGANGNYFYNAEKQFISNISSTTGVDITVPDNAVYLRFSATNDSSEVMVNFGKALLPYEPYQPGTTAALTLPETIYGGTVDAVSGVGSAQYVYQELAISDMDNAEDYPGWKNVPWINDVKHKSAADGSFATLGIYGVTNIADISQGAFWNSNGTQIYTTPDLWGGKTQSQIKEAYPELVVQFCLQLVTPTPFQASGNRPLSALPGTNTLYTDGNSLTVSGSTSPISAIESFKADVQASANQAEAVANILLGGA